jgi:hypothetical protein
MPRMSPVTPPGSLFKLPPPLRDKRHLEAIRACPCLFCARQAEPAHIRFSMFGEKPPTGLGTKPGDNWTVPLCPDHHRSGANAQHKSGERGWWERMGVDPLKVAKALYAVSPDVEKMRKIVFKILTSTDFLNDRSS